MPEVSWTSDKSMEGVSGLVEPFLKTFVFGINSSGYFYNTRQIIGLTVPTELPEGDGSMFGTLEGRGRHTNSVLLFYTFF